MATKILVGDTIRIQVTFRDWSSDGYGEIIDPDRVTVDLLDEQFNRTPEIEEATKADPGVYFFDWTPPKVGIWYIEFVGKFYDNAPPVWDAGQTYNEGDVVFYQESYYEANQSSLDSEPPSDPWTPIDPPPKTRSVVRQKFDVQKVGTSLVQSGTSPGKDQKLISNTFQQISVTSKHVDLTFKLSPKVSSLTNDGFTLYWVSNQGAVSNPPAVIDFSDLDTPNYEEISPDFEVIQTHKHYNSISRKLTLFFSEPKELETGWYALGIEGVNQANGSSFPPEAVIFFYNQEVTAPPPKGTTPTEFSIIDYSIKNGAFISTETINIANPNFHITATDPENGDIFLEEDYNRGQVTVSFSKRPKLNFINGNYIKVQRKRMAMEPTRWERIDNVKLAMDSTNPRLFVSFPSLTLDSENNPMHGVVGEPYFEDGYKYRVRISKDITAQP